DLRRPFHLYRTFSGGLRPSASNTFSGSTPRLPRIPRLDRRKYLRSPPAAASRISSSTVAEFLRRLYSASQISRAAARTRRSSEKYAVLVMVWRSAVE